ncbi:jg20699, partial [Pararge aegeria aegeria]
QPRRRARAPPHRHVPLRCQALAAEPTAHDALLTSHSSLLTAHFSLLNAHYSLLAVYCTSVCAACELGAVSAGRGEQQRVSYLPLSPYGPRNLGQNQPPPIIKMFSVRPVSQI